MFDALGFCGPDYSGGTALPRLSKCIFHMKSTNPDSITQPSLLWGSPTPLLFPCPSHSRARYQITKNTPAPQSTLKLFRLANPQTAYTA